MAGAAALRNEAFGIENSHSGSDENNCKAGAEGAQQNQTEPGAAKRNRSQQKNERRWARHKPAACAQRDQAADADVAFRRVGVIVAVVRVSKGAVVMVIVVVMMMLVRMRMIV